jgi:hypothetical protein
VRKVRVLQSHGMHAALMAHGSDVRDMPAHQAREPHSPYSSAELVPNVDALDAAAALTRRVTQMLRSTTGVQYFLPAATWPPVVVDSEE